MNSILLWAATLALPRLRHKDDGAVGALVIGIIIGVALVIFGIVKLLIPGD